MRKLMKFLTSLLKWLIALLAVGNLVALFVFNYRLPGFLHLPFDHTVTAETEKETPETETEGTAALQLSVPSQPLSYDGTDKLDLMDGVVVRNLAGIEQTGIKVFSTIKAGSSRTEKVVEYSVTDENGYRVTAERRLRIAGSYTGPNIEILGNMPDVEESELSHLVSILTGDDLISADDGFGNDVTSSVTSAVKYDSDDSGDSVVTLSITNMLNDTFATDVVIHTELPGPKLKLTTNKVTLNVGDGFSFYQYIAVCEDEEGNSLFDNISMNGSVDTYTPGEYVLEFYCTDGNGNRSPSKTLTVTVK